MSGGPAVFSQYISTLCVNVGIFGIGTIMGYSSPAGVLLTNNVNNTDLILTDYQYNWMSSISDLGAMMGCPLAGICMNYFGRRGTIMLAFIPPLIGWILIASAHNFPMILSGRIITGLYNSIMAMAAATYIGEYSSPHIRGSLGIVNQLMVSGGMLFAVSIGTAFNSFRIIGAICVIFPCICSFLMLFLKESPLYLLSKGKHKEAEEAMEFFRGKHYNGIVCEIESIKSTLEEIKKRPTTLADFRKLPYLHPFLMALGLFFFEQTSGFTAIFNNLSLIFKNKELQISEPIASNIYCLVQIIGTFVSIYLIDRAGRKFVLELSYLFMAISLVALGTYFYFDEYHHNLAVRVNWVPFVALIGYIAAYSCGSGPVPWIMLGELFSPEIKELSASIVTMSCFGLSFLVSLLHQPLKSILHHYGVFWVYAGFCVMSVIFSVTFVYETKGKSLQEINAHFGRPQLK